MYFDFSYLLTGSNIIVIDCKYYGAIAGVGGIVLPPA